MPPKEKFQPNEAAIQSLSDIVSMIERQDPRNRGFVVSRLMAIYGRGNTTSDQSKSSSSKTKGKAPMKKEAFNEAFEKTEEYLKMRKLRDELASVKKSGKKPDDELVARVKEAQDLAFSLKARMRAEHSNAAPAAAPSPAEPGNGQAGSSGSQPMEVTEAEGPGEAEGLEEFPVVSGSKRPAPGKTGVSPKGKR